MRKIVKRETIGGQPFHPDDYMIRIGRYFDRVASDTSSMTFEEWQPELAFNGDDVGSKLTISATGVVKVGRAAREVFWADGQPAALDSITIISVDDKWVKYGHGRNDKFLNPRVAGAAPL